MLDLTIQFGAVDSHTAAWKDLWVLTTPTNFPVFLRALGMASEGSANGQLRWQLVRLAAGGSPNPGTVTNAFARFHRQPLRTGEALPTGLALQSGPDAGAWSTPHTLFDSAGGGAADDDSSPYPRGQFSSNGGEMFRDFYFYSANGLYLPAASRIGLRVWNTAAANIVHGFGTLVF